jgi:hypothetical protein
MMLMIYLELMLLEVAVSYLHPKWPLKLIVIFTIYILLKLIILYYL